MSIRFTGIKSHSKRTERSLNSSSIQVEFSFAITRSTTNNKSISYQLVVGNAEDSKKKALGS